MWLNFEERSCVPDNGMALSGVLVEAMGGGVWYEILSGRYVLFFYFFGMGGCVGGYRYGYLDDK